MFLRNTFLKSRMWRLQSWILGAVLWMLTGSVLAQEAWGLFSPPAVAARAAVLMNPVTGEILFAKDPHLRLPPASTTKVLTALVVLERLNPNSQVLVSPQAASAPPSRIGLHAGEAASTQDLLYGLLLKSGNDAAETLAEAAGGSVYGFSNLMNAKAWQIGARNSHFMNPHGLPDEDHYSTAYDLALIFRHAMYYPMFADIVRTRSASLRIESSQGPYSDSRLVPVQNHNRLLASYEGARGGKTGFTLKARRCFVGEVDRGGVRLIVAILNSPTSGTLWQDARTLLDYGFARYGLAPPPPVQPEIEPQPTMVRRTPFMTPIAERVAMAQSVVEEEPEPEVIVRRAPVTPQTAKRVVVARPAVREKKLGYAAARTRPSAVSTKTATPAKTATPTKTVALQTKAVAKMHSAAKEKVATKSKPAAVALKGVKVDKPAAVAVVKPDKRAATKVVARAEPVVPRLSQKSTKRRI
jgi:D-alanyl-D-alanine carboxypeptidase